MVYVMKLSERQKLYTEKENVSYLVKSGRAFVYCCSFSDGKMVGIQNIAELDEGSVIPYFDFKEKNDRIIFMAMAETECELEPVDASRNHETAFLRMLQNRYDNDENDQNFEKAILTYLSIIREKQRQIINLEIERKNKLKYEVIKRNARNLYAGKTGKYSEHITGKNSLYNTVSVICGMKKVAIAPENRITEACGHTFSPEDIARISGFIIRKVVLPEKPQKYDLGPLLMLYGEEKKPYILQKKFGKVYFFSVDSAEELFLEDLENDSCEYYCISRPLPSGKVGGKQVFRFILSDVKIKDVILIIIGGFLVTLSTLQHASFTDKLFGMIIPYGRNVDVWNLAYFILAWIVGGLLFSIAKELSTFRVTSEMEYSLTGALYDRLFHMRESFFRNQESAQIEYRVSCLPSNYLSIITATISIILMGLYAGLYVFKMASYSSYLMVISVICAFISMGITLIVGMLNRKNQVAKNQKQASLRSGFYQMFTNIQNVRITGSEEEMLSTYFDEYAGYSRYDLKYSYGTTLSTLLLSAVNTAATVSFYYFMAGKQLGITTASFLAFISASSAFSGAMAAAASSLFTLIIMRPVLKNNAGLLAEPVERFESGKIIRKLRGNIRLSNVSFSYGTEKRKALDNVSMEIKPGESIGIVGSSGCGKSTIVRMLLGFDDPDTGKIFYDQDDLSSLNKVQLRRNIGTVLQNGVLFSGTIYKNISISNPNASENDVFEAAENACIKEDIEAMPLKYSTVVSEETTAISIGQKQRIMIARALLGKPSVLIFDEATSSLDNITQAKINENIAKMNCTRIIIAHRLSSVKNCDRIYVMDKGRIVETGTFDELMEKQGLFYQLSGGKTL